MKWDWLSHVLFAIGLSAFAYWAFTGGAKEYGSTEAYLAATLPFNILLIVTSVLVAFFTYRPLYRWYDAASTHKKVAFYLGLTLLCGFFFFLAVGYIKTVWFSNIWTTFCFMAITLMLMTFAREVMYMRRGKENVVAKPPPEPIEPIKPIDPNAPKPKTAEQIAAEEKAEALRKSRERVEEILRKKRDPR